MSSCASCWPGGKKLVRQAQVPDAEVDAWELMELPLLWKRAVIFFKEMIK